MWYVAFLLSYGSSKSAALTTLSAESQIATSPCLDGSHLDPRRCPALTSDQSSLVAPIRPLQSSAAGRNLCRSYNCSPITRPRARCTAQPRHSVSSMAYRTRRQDPNNGVYLAISPVCCLLSGNVSDVNAGIYLSTIKIIAALGSSLQPPQPYTPPRHDWLAIFHANVKC